MLLNHKSPHSVCTIFLKSCLKKPNFVLKATKSSLSTSFFSIFFRFEDAFSVSSFSLFHTILTNYISQCFGSFGQNLKYFWSVLELWKCTWPGHVILLFEKMRGLSQKIEKESIASRVRSCDSSTFIRCPPILICSFSQDSAIWSILIRE